MAIILGLAASPWRATLTIALTLTAYVCMCIRSSINCACLLAHYLVCDSSVARKRRGENTQNMKKGSLTQQDEKIIAPLHGEGATRPSLSQSKAINKLYVVLNRRTTGFEAQKVWNSRSGRSVSSAWSDSGRSMLPTRYAFIFVHKRTQNQETWNELRT